MNVILYMALTVNGMIAKEDGNSEWVSEEDTRSFTEVCQKAGAVIMGKHTYDILYPDYLPLKKGIHVVLSHDIDAKSDNNTVYFTDKYPQEVLSMLEQKDYKEVVIIGGSQTVSQFMQDGLIHEAYFDIEPLLFGKGMTIFRNTNFEYRLKLLNTKKLNENTIQLHYKVARFIKPKKGTLKGLLGSMKGKIHFAPDYDEADQEILDMFEESINKPL